MRITKTKTWCQAAMLSLALNSAAASADTVLHGLVGIYSHDIKISPRGIRDSADINRVIGSKTDGLRYCFETGLKRDPRIEGTMIVELTISMDGHVETARFNRADIREQEFQSCILKKIARFHFWPAAESTAVSVPIGFSSQEERMSPLGRKLPTYPIYIVPPKAPGSTEQ